VKEALFHPKALQSIREFPKPARKALGKAIWELQLGTRLLLPLSKPMPEVSSGVSEIRVRDTSGAYRAFYYTKLRQGILIFHAFEKKSQKTPQQELTAGRRRLKEMLYGFEGR
jgi:phage-related protein